MSLSDTAEYWQDVKGGFRPKKVFTHSSKLDCGHFHVVESNELDEIDCYACLKMIEVDEELMQELTKNNGKAKLNYRKKNGYRLHSKISFGKYKGETVEFIVRNDLSYFNWIKGKIVVHPEVDLFILEK